MHAAQCSDRSQTFGVAVQKHLGDSKEFAHLVQSLRWQMTRRRNIGSAMRSPTINSSTDATECKPW